MSERDDIALVRASLHPAGQARAAFERLMAPQKTLAQHGLTRRQRQLLDFIAGYADKNGVPPTCREMASHLGLKNRGGVILILDELQERGHIRRIPHAHRSIALVRHG